MEFYKNLYIGETINNPERVKKRLRSNAGQLAVYVVALAKGRDQLEIYHCAYLQQKYYKLHPPVIIGIGNGYEEAVDIVIRITREALDQNGDCDLKKYLYPEGLSGRKDAAGEW